MPPGCGCCIPSLTRHPTYRLRPCRDLLAGVTLRDYLSTRPPRAVTSVATTDQLGAVLRRFAAGGLVAAPLFADEARTAYLGFIDLLDVVAAVVEAARLSAGSSGSGHELRQRAAATANALASQPVGTIRAATNDAQVVYLSQLGSSLLEVVREGFAAPVDNLACHRLAVFQPSGGSMSSGSSRSSSSPELAAMDADGSGSSSLQLTHIVSQSDVLRFLHRHRHQLGQWLLDSTLAQAGGCCQPADQGRGCMHAWRCFVQCPWM